MLRIKYFIFTLLIVSFSLQQTVSAAGSVSERCLAPWHAVFDNILTRDLQEYRLFSEGVVSEFYRSRSTKRVILYWGNKRADVGREEVEAYLHLTKKFELAIKSSSIAEHVIIPQQRLVRLTNGNYAVEMDYIEGRWAFPVVFDIADDQSSFTLDDRYALGEFLMKQNGKTSSARNKALRHVIDQTFEISASLFNGNGHFHPLPSLFDFDNVSVDGLDGHFIPVKYLDSRGLLKKPENFQVVISDMIHIGGAVTFVEKYRKTEGFPYGSEKALTRFKNGINTHDVFEVIIAYHDLKMKGFVFSEALHHYFDGGIPHEQIKNFLRYVSASDSEYEVVYIKLSSLNPPKIELKLTQRGRQVERLSKLKAELFEMKEGRGFEMRHILTGLSDLLLELDSNLDFLLRHPEHPGFNHLLKDLFSENPSFMLSLEFPEKKSAYSKVSLKSV